MNQIVLKFKNLVLQYKVYFKSTFLYLFASLFTAAIGVFLNPFMAKNLSPYDYSIMGYFSSFSNIILPVLNFSMISYYLRNYFIIPEDRRQIVSDTILLTLLIYGFAVLFLTILIFYFYLRWFNISFPFYPYVLLSFIPIYLSNFLLLYQINCRIKREAGKYSKVTILNAILNSLLAIIFVIIYKYGSEGRLLATLIASFFTAIYCFKKLFKKLQFDFQVIKDAFKFGWPLSLSAIFWFFISGIDRSMLEKLNDNNSFGLYNIGLQFSTYFTIFYTAISNTFEPDIYKALAENKKRKLIKIIGSILFLNAIPNFLFILFAKIIINILTSNRYTDAYSFAQIFALKNIIFALYYSLITIIIGYGFTKSELILRIIGALFCIIMFKFLIAYYGFYGAAWGQVLSLILMSILAFIFLLFKNSIKKKKILYQN